MTRARLDGMLLLLFGSVLVTVRLHSAISVFRPSPRNYNPVLKLICAPPLLL
jgi:hypothetical protein